MYLRAKTSGQSKNIMVQGEKKSAFLCVGMCIHTGRKKTNVTKMLTGKYRYYY